MLNKHYDAETPEILNDVVAALVTDFAGVQSLTTVEGYVLAVYERITGDAKLPDYLPLLVHRAARNNLRKMSA